MTWTRPVFLSSLMALLACSPAPPPQPADDSALLHEVAESYWRFLLADEVELQLKYGETVERLPDVTLARARERSETASRHLARLGQVRPERLSHAEWVRLETLRWDLAIEAERQRHYWLHFPITPRVVRNTEMPGLFTSFELKEPADLERYLRLLGQYPGYVEAVLAKVEGQAERGIRLPRDEIDLVLPMWRSFQAAGEESPFYVAADRLAGFAAGDAAVFQAEVRRIVDEEVVPALTRLTDYLAGAYREEAPEALGYGQYPGGADYYRYVARFFTTVETPPEELHKTGLAGVASLLEEMDEVRRATGFAGTREEFHRFIRTDPRFLATTPDEVRDRLLSYLTKIEPRLDAFFSRRPRAPYGIRRLRPELEGGVTYGYYHPPTDADPTGYYYFNGSRLDQRSLVTAEGLIYHELVPGHHFQVALQSENEDLPLYFRNNFYSAHAEGWAVYASQLAIEMGLYEDPYSLYGRLGGDLKFAARVVVDTGLNALGWSSERATEYMREHTIESATQIHGEILRYGVGLPGQALAYKIGGDKIWQLRRRAEQALGERFDVRRFHDQILDYGPMPLAVLEKHLDRFIAEASAR